MKNFRIVIQAEIRDAITSRWFLLYALIFGGAVIALFWTGITESRVMGFTGISRLLLTYFQLCIVILPIFIMITTVRSFVGDRESSVMEYLLSLPVSLRDYYWGKCIGRFLVILAPILGVMVVAAAWTRLKGVNIEYGIFFVYCILLCAMSWFFLGTAMLLSSVVNRQESGYGFAFLLWLLLVLFLDIVLIGIFLKYQISPELTIGIALLNPLQDFRVASMALFDPDLTMLGPSSWFILERFGKTGFIVFSILYTGISGMAAALGGFMVFSRRDVV